jgi:hypothetical protein
LKIENLILLSANKALACVLNSLTSCGIPLDATVFHPVIAKFAINF